MSGLLITAFVVSLLGLAACALLVLSANDTAADRQNLDEQIEQLRAHAAQRRRDQQREREAYVADLRRPR